MLLRLKEDPREWLKFAVASLLMVAALAVLLWSRHRISQPVLIRALALILLALVFCALRPRWLRQPYRFGMTAGFFIGQGFGFVLLLLVFLLVLTPLGLLLRLMGKDLLELKKVSGTTTYWQNARATDQLDRQY